MDEKIEHNSRKQVKWATVVSYIAIILNIIAGLIYTPWLIIHIGDSNYGIYSIVTSIITMLIMDFGISEAVAKYVAQYRTEGKENEIGSLLGLVLKIYLLLSIIFLIIFIFFYFMVEHIYVGLTATEISKLKQAYIIVAAYNVIAFTFTPLSGIMLAYEHLINLKLADILNKILVIVISAIAILLGGELMAVVIANAMAGIVTIIYKLLVIQKNHHFKIDIRYNNRKLLKEILKFSVWIAIMVIAQRCIYSITPSILGALSNSKEVTYFSLASTLEGYAYSFGSVIAGLYLARLTRILLADDKNAFNRLIVKVGKLQYVLILLIFVGFICVGDSFVYMWMGEGYSKVYYCTILMLMPDMLLWPFMIPATGLTVLNKVKEYSLVHVIMAVINMVLEAIFANRYGAIGAAVGICTATIIKAFLVMVVYKRHLPIDMMGFVKQVFLPYGLGAGVALVLSRLVLNNVASAVNSWGAVLLKGLITSTIYIMCICIIGVIFDKETRETVSKMFIRREK